MIRPISAHKLIQRSGTAADQISISEKVGNIISRVHRSWRRTMPNVKSDMNGNKFYPHERFLALVHSGCCVLHSQHAHSRTKNFVFITNESLRKSRFGCLYLMSPCWLTSVVCCVNTIHIVHQITDNWGH